MSLDRNLGNKSVNNLLIVMKTLFNTLVERKIITKNPAAKIEPLKTQSESHVSYTPNEQAILEAHLQAHYPGLYLFTRFIYFAFLRPVELCRLKRRNLLQEEWVIVIGADQSKNRKQQSIYMVDPLYEVLKNEDLDCLFPDTYLFAKYLLYIFPK